MRRGWVQDSTYGLLLLLGSLACDGLTGPVQENVKVKYGASPYQIMFYCNFWAIFYLVVGVYMNEGLDGVEFAMARPELMQKIASFCVVSAIGQIFIFLTLTKFK